jgi:glutamine synthetase
MTDKHDESGKFFSLHPEVSQVLLILTDINGIARGKLVRPHELEVIFDRGRPLPSSILSLNALGEDVDSTGLVWEVGDMDCFARPVPGSLKICPWIKNTAQLLLSMDPVAGMPAASADPRLKLAQVADRLKQDGYHPVLACELEFYLLDAEAWADGEVKPTRTCRGLPLEQTQVYGVQDLEDMSEFFEDVYLCSAEQGLPAETVISEYAPGQFEITLTHREDALQAVDEAIEFKRLIKGVAEQYGMIACFMAKPFAELSGSGMHIHVSLADEQGNNLFSCEDAQGNELLRHSIGGMADSISDCMAIFAPNANSYRRFRPNSYAPVAPTWGVNNRTVTFRVPTGPASSRHVEHRASGADANPYLAAAAVLAGMHHGIKNKMDPGPAISGDGYANADTSLTINWYAALDGFEKSTFVTEYFGAEFQHIFSALKRDECNQFFAQVSELDHRWHLRLA